MGIERAHRIIRNVVLPGIYETYIESDVIVSDIRNIANHAGFVGEALEESVKSELLGAAAVDSTIAQTMETARTAAANANLSIDRAVGDDPDHYLRALTEDDFASINNTLDEVGSRVQASIETVENLHQKVDTIIGKLTIFYDQLHEGASSSARKSGVGYAEAKEALEAILGDSNS